MWTDGKREKRKERGRERREREKEREREREREHQALAANAATQPRAKFGPHTSSRMNGAAFFSNQLAG